MQDRAQIDSSRSAKIIFIFASATVVFVGIPAWLIFGPVALIVCAISFVVASLAALRCLTSSQSSDIVGPPSNLDLKRLIEHVMTPELPQKPEPPQKPAPPDSGKASRSPMTIILAGLAAIFLAGTFALLVLAAIGPTAIAVMGIGAAIFAVAGLQYLVWGWWLGPAIRRDAEAEAARQLSDNEPRTGGDQHE